MLDYQKAFMGQMIQSPNKPINHEPFAIWKIWLQWYGVMTYLIWKILNNSGRSGLFPTPSHDTAIPLATWRATIRVCRANSLKDPGVTSAQHGALAVALRYAVTHWQRAPNVSLLSIKYACTWFVLKYAFVSKPFPIFYCAVVYLGQLELDIDLLAHETVMDILLGLGSHSSMLHRTNTPATCPSMQSLPPSHIW